jgi:ATP-dependent Clp protease ATP-binding subunit ClpA
VFADLTDGLTLRSMLAISQLARDQGIALPGIADAVRLYKVGIPDNPWRQDYLKEKIRTGADAIARRIKGQDQAVRKTLDILTRSVMGLSGAQASANGSRPRGVLFFAGPTGVGKTELAKAVTQLIFGDDQAYKRFDMSEFAAEHSDARLLGAPPGYVGHDAGGELVNAVRQRPFSVLLFDEIEKAHPRILDKFLQVLEDGRLTDGRGETVFFSEAVIVFTSNLGIYIEQEDGTRVQNVAPSTPTDEVERKIRGAIDRHFRFKLQRPELLNRIGDNVIVFDFIRPEVASSIFDKMVANVIERVRDEHAIAVDMNSEVRGRILALCTQDLENGGRGIGNRLETVLINPLARALFDRSPPRGSAVTIRGHREEHGVHTLELS